MPVYALDLPAALDPEAVVLDDGAAFHPVVAPGAPAAASRAGVAVAAKPARDADTADALTAAALAALDPDTLLVDVEPCALAGVAAVRTLALVQLGGVASVVLEQWRLVAAGERWVVTATADLAAWASLAPVLRGAATSLAIEAETP